MGPGGAAGETAVNKPNTHPGGLGLGRSVTSRIGSKFRSSPPSMTVVWEDIWLVALFKGFPLWFTDGVLPENTPPDVGHSPYPIDEGTGQHLDPPITYQQSGVSSDVRLRRFTLGSSSVHP
jgi:hypothetical protein